MASFTTSLIGQDETVNILNQVLSNPPHIFLSGGYGTGKTTILHEFLKAYYTPHGISPTDPQWTLWLSSEQDRGIHCVRQSVTEFVRHSSARPGVYRWIVVDDADSLPMISQQALRRPMETHGHTTRFLFISRYSSDLIQPLKSRCLHIELENISPLLLASHYAAQAGYPALQLDSSAIGILMSLSQTPTEIHHILNILCKIYGASSEPITSKHIMALFTSPSFSLCLDLLKAYIRGDKDIMKSIFLEIWTTGISYEDFLYELTSAVYQLGILSPKTSQDIHQLILKGWISFAQGKTHSLDAMRLFFTETAGQA
jgi:DNA polymerase III gamma/tau subunit